MAWSVGTALREAAETAVTWVFAGGMKLGLWTLPTVKDKNGRVRATQRLCDLIMWTGIVVTSALTGLLIVKVLIGAAYSEGRRVEHAAEVRKRQLQGRAL